MECKWLHDEIIKLMKSCIDALLSIALHLKISAKQTTEYLRIKEVVQIILLLFILMVNEKKKR